MEQEKSIDGWSSFLELCSQIQTPETFNHFFELFLTFEERQTIAARYLIIQALIEGKLTQRKIAETRKVSVAQITRGSNALKIIDPILKKFLEDKISTFL
jgi:TrpR family trp operon transcriptional repressor